MPEAGPVWRRDIQARELAELDRHVVAALASVETRESDVTRNAAMRLPVLLSRRGRTRRRLAMEERLLRNGLVEVARALNSVGSLRSVQDRAADVVSRLFAPCRCFLIPDEDLPQPGSAISVLLDDGLAPVRRIVVECSENVAADSTARSYLETVAALITMGLRARSAEQATEDRIHHLQHEWSQLLDQLQPEAPALTPREREVLALVRDGCSNAAIAQELFVTVETVKSHVRSLLGKYGVHRRTALMTAQPKE